MSMPSPGSAWLAPVGPMPATLDRAGLTQRLRLTALSAARLRVTTKAIDRHINNIFTKLDLPPAPDDNRRVLAVLAWLGAGRGSPAR